MTFRELEGDSWRGNAPADTTPQPKQQPPDAETADSLYPRLDPNDVWLYQKTIEAALRRNIPDPMNSRFLLMLRVLGARARIAHELEHESGHYIGLDNG